MPKRRKRRASNQGEELIGLFLGFFGGYIFAELLLARFLHPLHWLVAFSAAAVGYYGVLIWYRWHRPTQHH